MHATANGRPPRTAKLTPQQLQCLRYAALCASPKETAFEMKISSKTVEYHIEQLKQKLGLYSKPELIRFAIESGYVKRGERYVSSDTNKQTPVAELKLLGTGKLVDSLVLAGDKVAAAIQEGSADPIQIDSLVKITDCLVNVAHLQMQLDDRKLSVPWLNSMKQIK